MSVLAILPNETSRVAEGVFALRNAPSLVFSGRSAAVLVDVENTTGNRDLGCM